MSRWEKNEFQHAGEFEKFVKVLLDNNVRSYLEIGSRYGGSLWGVGIRLPNDSLLVSVERHVMQELLQCADTLRTRGQRSKIIPGDSRDESTIAAVRKLAPFDALLIDGSHDYASAESDYKNYGPMAKIVAFHDATAGIVTKKKPWKADVARFYESIKGERNLLIKEPGGIGFGIIFQ